MHTYDHFLKILFFSSLYPSQAKAHILETKRFMLPQLSQQVPQNSFIIRRRKCDQSQIQICHSFLRRRDDRIPVIQEQGLKLVRFIRASNRSQHLGHCRQLSPSWTVSAAGAVQRSQQRPALPLGSDPIACLHYSRTFFKRFAFSFPPCWIPSSTVSIGVCCQHPISWRLPGDAISSSSHSPISPFFLQQSLKKLDTFPVSRFSPLLFFGSQSIFYPPHSAQSAGQSWPAITMWCTQRSVLI